MSSLLQKIAHQKHQQSLVSFVVIQLLSLQKTNLGYNLTQLDERRIILCP
jgi:hypothetical protein